MNKHPLVSLMAARWKDELQNVSSDNLERSWQQTFCTFDKKIADHGTSQQRDWYVLSPATGSGKTQALILYAAEVSRNDYSAPGILIATRLIAQADDVVAQINERAGEIVAVAAHSQSDTPRERLKDYPVVVICHAAYTGPTRHREEWQEYMRFLGGDGTRKLVVIDEALTLLDISRVDLNVISRLRGMIPAWLADKYPVGYEAITSMEKLLLDIRSLPKDKTSSARVVIPEERREYLKVFEDGFAGFEELAEIRKAMRSDKNRYLLGKKNVDEQAEQRQKRRYDGVFADLLAIYDSFVLHVKAGTSHTLNTAQKLIPDEDIGCVILDATADCNPIYECLVREGEKNVLKVPAITCRTYQNATLYASFGHAVGRSSLVKAGDGKPKIVDVAPKLFAALRDQYAKRKGTVCPMERVLIVCYKDAKPHLEGFDTPFEYSTAHYGALDGRNDWRDYDSVVIIGLDYRHPADAPALIMALQPQFQTNAFLHNPDERQFAGYSDIRKATDRGTIVASAIQAVNRIATRRVMDGQGNCPPSAVYILLPGNELGREVHSQITQAMPGIRTKDWIVRAARAKPRSKHEKALMTFADCMVSGESWSASKLKQHLSIPKTSWERISAKLRDDTSALSQSLRDLGVAYTVTRTGKTQTGQLAKS